VSQRIWSSLVCSTQKVTELTANLNEIQTRTFAVTNTSLDKYLCFKLLGTAPSRYSIKPISGIVDPKTTCQFSSTVLYFSLPLVSLNLSKGPPDQKQREEGRLVDKFRFQTKLVSHLPSTPADLAGVLSSGLNSSLIMVTVTLPVNETEQATDEVR
jgi:hypothetical protein